MFGKAKKKSQKQLDELCCQVDIFIQVHFVRERGNTNRSKSDRNKFNTLILKDDPMRRELKEFLESNCFTYNCSELCILFLQKCGKDETIVCDRAHLDKAYFSNIRNSYSFIPSKSEAIALCLGMRLNIEEAKLLLDLAGQELSNSQKPDLAVRYFIENNLYNIDELNYVLEKLCDTALEKIS